MDARTTSITRLPRGRQLVSKQIRLLQDRIGRAPLCISFLTF